MTFLEVLREWGCSWLWERMTIIGGTEWIVQAITAGSLVAITDGLYTRQLYPHLCSAAFVLECSYGRGRLVGLFKEASKAAIAYRGELLGLMVIHLILVSVNWVHKSLSGSAKVVSDCLGALQWVTYLPPLLNSIKMQTFRYLKIYTCELSGFDIQYKLLPREGASGQHDAIQKVEQELATQLYM